MPGSDNFKCDVVILAAGKGKRMHQAFPGVPKALVPLAGKPMLVRVLDAVERSGVANKVVVVVGPVVEQKVRQALAGRQVEFSFQVEPQGTGHAVLCTRPQTADSGDLLVLYGDQPLYSARTIRKIVEHHIESNALVTMLTVKLPDFRGWRAAFADWSRIIRGKDGQFLRSIEAKDAKGKELAITEVNPSLYCFKTDWLFAHLPQVGCANVQNEHYLPDVLSMAVSEGGRVETVIAPEPRETLGANTPEQLVILEQVYAEVKELWEK